MIFSNTTKKSISVISMFMVMIMGFATAFAPVSTYAAEDDGYGVGDKVKLVHDHQIRYGSGDGGYSNLMEAHGIDDSLGNRPVFCTQPNMPTPSAGTYTIDKMYTSDSGKSDVLRKLVYYAKGYPGWSWAKDKWFSSGSWSSDDIYGIFHIAVFYIKNSGYQNIIGGILENGYAKIKKTSANTDITNGNDCYSLGGAQFGLYKDGSKVATITTKADGTSNTVEVSAGTYTLKEDVCPKGYAKAAVDSGEPTRQWVLKTDEDGFCDLDEKYLVSGDKFYHASNGEVTLPLGTVLIRESKAPEGYLLSNEVYVRNITSDGHAEMVKTYKEPTTPEQVKRGDLEFVKVKDASMARLAGVPFKITSKTTGESHIIVTDANGYANTSSSWNLHTNNTNRGQSDEDGIWFEMYREGNKTTKVDNALGALPYDLYVLDEMPCDANKGCRLLEGIEIAITRDSVTVKLGTLTDDAIEIETTAKDSETGGHFAKADEKVTIVDTVKYTGLYKNKEYVMKGTLMDKETGKPLLDKEGKEITAEQKFTAKSDNGTVEMSFTFDASLMQGKTTVVFESVFYNDLEVAVHADIEDEDQTVTFGQPPAEHSPKTGDDLPMIPIIALLAASAAGITAALIRRKHKAGSDDSDE